MEVAYIVQGDALVPEFSKRNICRLYRMEGTRIGKEADPPRILTGKHKPVFPVGRFPVSLICSHINGSGIPETVHQKDDFHLFRFFLFINRLCSVLHRRTAFSLIFFFDGVQFTHQDGGHGISAFQYILIAINIGKGFFMLLHQRIQFQSDEPVQTHFQDGVGLFLGKTQQSCHHHGFFGFECNPFRFSLHQAVFSHGSVPGTPQDFDNQVDDIAGFDQPFLDLFFLLFFRQECGILALRQFKLKLHTGADHFPQPHGLRSAICYGQHIDAKGIFQTGFFIKQVFKIFHIRVFAQFYYNADPFFGRLIGNIHNIHRLFRLSQRRHIRQKPGDAGADHGIGNFRDHQIHPSRFAFFHFHPAPDADFPRSGLINLFQI